MPAATLPFSAFPFCGPSYQQLSPVLDAQRSINLYPEKAMEPGAKTPVTLVGRPGLDLFTTLDHGPVRALWAGNGRLFAVGGAYFYEINPSNGAIITDYGAMVSSLGTGPCQIVANGTQLLVMDPSIPRIFNADAGTPVMTGVYFGHSLEYLDTFYYTLDNAVENRVQQSATLDGTTWPALDYTDITGTVDIKTRLIVVNSLMWIMGQNNIEVWYNAGNAGFALERMQSGTLNVGIYGEGTNSVSATAVRIRNTLLWFGADERGYGKFWRADGLTPVQISTPGIEAIIMGYGNVNDAYSFAEEYDGHIFYVTNFPRANSSNGATLVYDMTTNEWHERSYNDNGTAKQARPSCFASLVTTGSTAPKNFVGDYENGNIYIQDSSYTSDDGDSIVYTRTAPHVSNSFRRLKHQSLTLDAAIGTATPTVAYSDDGGVTFGSFSNMQQTSSVAGDGTLMYQAWQLGLGRDRVYKVVITDDSNVIRISNAWLAVEAGTEQ